MKMFRGFKEVRAMFSLMVVLVFFLGLSALIVITRQQEFILELEETHAASELDLIGTLAREALIRRDYVTVDQFFNSWGMDNPDVVSIGADSPNGFYLALYERETATRYPLKVSRDIYYSGNRLISMSLVKDLSEARARMTRLRFQSTVALAAFALTMGAVLWFTVRRTAILPMERLVEEVKELNIGLEKRVEERTADLMSANETLKREMEERKTVEQRLRLSKLELENQNKELKKLDTLKDALVRDISHELKTPVAKHLMQLEIAGDILERKGALHDFKDVLQVMELGIRRQEAAIRNILLMSRLETGGRKTDLSSFPLAEFIEEVVNDYMHAISAYGIRLQMDLISLVLASDRELLWHVMANIIHNSIKYRSQTDPQLHILTVREDGTVRIEVTDNGTGLSREEREQAFDRFYQSSSSIEGVGLGLNIAKTIIESLDGSIRINSDGRDKGTTVTITLPISLKGTAKSPAPKPLVRP